MHLNLTVADEMSTDPITIMPHQTLKDAYKLMYSKNIRHLPVVDAEGKICGIISDRDIQRGMDSKVASTLGFRFESLSLDDEKKVMDYMTWPLKIISRDCTLRDAAKQMLTDRVSSLVVVEDEEMVGIITTDDMLHTLILLLDDKEGEIMNLDEVMNTARTKAAFAATSVPVGGIIEGDIAPDDSEDVEEEATLSPEDLKTLRLKRERDEEKANLQEMTAYHWNIWQPVLM